MTTLFDHWGLLWRFVECDIKIRYKQAVLGALWAVVSPLAMLLIVTVVFSRYAQSDLGRVPYPIYAYCGISLWSFFSSALAMACTSLVDSRDLITAVYFRREILPFSKIGSRFLDFAVGSLLLLLLMQWYKIPLSPHVLLAPAILCCQLMVMAGFALLLAAGQLFFRDVKLLFDVAILLWLFATPVFYPLTALAPHFRWLALLNPLTPIIESYRSLLIYGQLPSTLLVGLSLAYGLGIYGLGLTVFRKLDPLLAEYV